MSIRKRTQLSVLGLVLLTQTSVWTPAMSDAPATMSHPISIPASASASSQGAEQIRGWIKTARAHIHVDYVSGKDWAAHNWLWLAAMGVSITTGIVVAFQ